MPRSTTSSPARRAASASDVTCANTYGGRRRSLWKSWRIADTAAPDASSAGGRRPPKLSENFPGGKRAVMTGRLPREGTVFLLNRAAAEEEVDREPGA